MKFQKYISLLALLLATGSVQSQVQLNLGSLAIYRLNGNGIDRSYYKNHLSIFKTRDTTDRNGNLKSCMYFDGTEAILKGPNINLPQGDGERTVAFWFNALDTHATNPGQGLLSYGVDTSTRGFQVFIKDTIVKGNNLLRISGINSDVDLAYTYQTGKWTHFAMTYELDSISTWINGVQISRKTVPISWNTKADTLQIGRAISGKNHPGFFHGMIDDVWFFDRVLNKAEINQLFVGCKDTVVTSKDTILCGDSIFFNDMYLKSAGIYRDTLIASTGCDSIAILNLFVDPYLFSTAKDTICKGGGVVIGGIHRQTAGVYNDTLRNSAGCYEVKRITLQVDSIDAGVKISGDTLMALQNNAHYEWYDCSNSTQVSKKRNFRPSKNSSYKLRVEKGKCIAWSSCIPITLLSTNTEKIDNIYLAYPNPTTGLLYVKMHINNPDVFDAIPRLWNILGEEMVVTIKQKTPEQWLLNMEGLKPGIYLLELGNSTEKIYQRILKK